MHARTSDPPSTAPAGGRSLWRRLVDGLADIGDRAGLDHRLVGFATHFPLTRPIARRRAAALFDLCAGFVYSQVLVAAVDLGLFDLLREGARDETDLARALGLAEAAARRLLLAAKPLGLVKPAGPDRWRLGPLGRAVAADPGIAAMVAHHRLLYADLADPVALLRGTRSERALSGFWAYAETAPEAEISAERTGRYTALMSDSQAMVARETIHAVSFAGSRRILDVGGGDGTFLEAVARAAPEAELVLFDLPPVAEAAAARFARGGLAGRARAIGGDFRRDPLPTGADLLCLVRVLHDHDDDTVRALLAAARHALAPGGRLLVAEPMAEAPGAERVGGAYFGFYLLAMGQGRARSAAELHAFLAEAGFVAIEHRPTALPIVASVLVACAAPYRV